MRCLACFVVAMSSCWSEVRAADDGPQPAELFKSLDKNGDGVLAADELDEKQKRFFARLVRVGDKDGDGKLSRAEFLAASNKPETPVTGAGGFRQGGPQRRDYDPEQFFRRLDRNNDGKLTLEELPEPLRPRFKPAFDRLGKKELTKQEFLNLRRGRPGGNRPTGNRPGAIPVDSLKALDKNKDGKLALSELPEQVRPRLKPLFDRLGKTEISLAELERMAQRNRDRRPQGARPGQSDRTLDATFDRFDVNKDGKITLAEAPQRAKLYVRGMLRRLQKGEDGAISKEEFTRIARQGPQQRGRPGGPAAEALFRRLDANKDGKITEAETSGPMKANFGRIDRDSDGSISLEELRQVVRGRDAAGQRPGTDSPRRKRPRQ